MTRILIVDDDPAIAGALRINLKAHGYQAHTVQSGEEALRVMGEVMPDVAVLDLGLPGMDGTDVITRVRGFSELPILVLSARHESEDKVRALDAGADDYVTKPFGLDEFMARLRALERRIHAPARPPVVATGELHIDLAQKQVQRGDKVVRLTPTEWKILEALAQRHGTLVAQGDILRQVWGARYADQTNYLRVYVNQLRRKLEKDPALPHHIVTEPGMGYRLV